MAHAADRIAWYRVPLPREELRRLTDRRDFPALVQAVGFLLVIAATGTASWVAWDAAESGRFPVWGVVALVFLHGTVWAFLLNGFHELVHHTVFRTRWLGTLFLYLYSFLGWLDPVEFKASHTRHHLHTLHPPRDREVRLPIRMRLRDYLGVAIVDPLGIYHRTKGAIIKATGGYTSDWVRDNFEEDGPDAQRRLRRWNRFFLLGHAIIVAVAIATGTWQLAVLVTFAIFYGRWLEFACNETQHIGLRDNVDDFRLCCRTFTLNPIVRFLYWHMNYHTEHHMYAAVPCYRLHRLHRLIRHELPPRPRGIVGTWREIIGILRKQRDDPDYAFTPELPARSAHRPPPSPAG